MGGLFSRKVVETQNNDSVSKYRTTKKIGEGSSGNVFLAEDEHGEKYIVKSFKEVGGERYEVQILKKIRKNCNPYLTCLHKIEKHGGKLFVILKYVENSQDLRDFLYKNFKRMNLYHKLLIAQKISRGVEQLHSMGIVHRDIKPENILIVTTDDKNDLNTRLIDYDLAQYKTNFPVCELAGTKIYIDPAASYLYKKKYQMSFDVWKQADNYSLGLTFFDIAFNVKFWENNDDDGFILYELLKSNNAKKNNSVLGKKLQNRIQYSLDKYKKKFKQSEETVNIFFPLISEMISFPPDRRPNIKQVRKYIDDAVEIYKPV